METELEKLLADGWVDTHEPYGDCVILSKDDDRILFDKKKDEISFKYNIKNKL